MSQSPDEFNTIRLHDLIDAYQQGDRAAADELIRAAGERLQLLTRKLLRGFPAVRGYAETGDVFQSSLLRLLQTLQNLRPESTRHFYNLAAVHIRRELIDLSRRLRGRAEPMGGTDDADGGPLNAVADRLPAPDFELWSRFHEAVDQLPVEEREVVSLVFYHGWKQKQIAELFSVDERTVRRRWTSACLRLNELVGGELPRP